MALDATVPQLWYSNNAAFIAASGTAAKVLVDASPASGNLLGGARVLDATVASTDGSARDMTVWEGKVLTTVGTATGSATITTANTINRTTGDFRTDGWRAGDNVMVFAALNAAPAGSDGVLATITAVAALTLTVNGTPLTNETLATGCRIVKVAPTVRVPVPANSGTNSTAANVRLVGNTTYDAVLDLTGRQLAADTLLAVSMAAAVSALPAYVSACARVGLY